MSITFLFLLQPAIAVAASWWDPCVAFHISGLLHSPSLPQNAFTAITFRSLVVNRVHEGYSKFTSINCTLPNHFCHLNFLISLSQTKGWDNLLLKLNNNFVREPERLREQINLVNKLIMHGPKRILYKQAHIRAKNKYEIYHKKPRWEVIVFNN